MGRSISSGDIKTKRERKRKREREREKEEDFYSNIFAHSRTRRYIYIYTRA